MFRTLLRHARIPSITLALWCVTAAAGSRMPQPVWVVSYVEATADAVPALRKRLREYARQLGHETDPPEVELLSELHRPARMVVIERWPALDDGTARRAGDALQQRIAGETVGPLDRRANTPLTPLITTAPRTGAFVMLMHVDVAPAGAKLAAQWLTAQRTAVLAAPGAIAYEAATQTDHVNHFGVYEVWRNETSYEAYVDTAPSQQLRTQLAAYKGALYDDRFYRVVQSWSFATSR